MTRGVDAGVDEGAGLDPGHDITQGSNLRDGEGIPSILRGLRCVAAAVLDADGVCLDANLGFGLLLDQDGPPGAESVAHWFQQPSFPALLEATAASGHFSGCMNFGDGLSFMRSVQGQVWRRGGQLLLLAEHDVAELERMGAAVTQLNERLADAQRELVRANRRLERDKQEIRRLTLTDPLTGLANRRAFDERCQDELARAGPDAALSLIMADIDHFKSVNDTYGHALGDDALVAFAGALTGNTRDDDLAARLGGEEFCVLLADGRLDEAERIAERIRQAVLELRVEGIDRVLSASFGVARLAASEGVDALLITADKALYEAKQQGRNRVVVAHPPVD